MGAWGTGIYQNENASEFLRKIVIVSIAAANKINEDTGKGPFDPKTSKMPKDAMPYVEKALGTASTPEEKLVTLDLACETGDVALIRRMRADTLDSLSGELSPEQLMSWRDVRGRRGMIDGLIERCDEVAMAKRRNKPKFPPEWIQLLVAKQNT